jgi:hypothetical protein
MLSLKIGSMKMGPVPSLKIIEPMQKLSSIMDAKTNIPASLESSLIASAVADMFETDISLEEARLLKSYMNTVLLVQEDNISMQTKTYDQHLVAYLDNLGIKELSFDETEYFKYVKTMKVKGLELEYNKLAFYMIHLRYLKFTAETPNPKLRINRLMGKAVNKIVSVSEEDGFSMATGTKMGGTSRSQLLSGKLSLDSSK